jgi:uncharacterized protein
MLMDEIRPLESLAIGYSGGVDSSLVVAAAVRALGRDRVLAVTARSETLPRYELEAARSLARELGAAHEVIETREMDNEEFRANPPGRCYHCKKELWSRIGSLARERGLRNMADGTNADDAGDHRPGARAGDEAGIAHPLAAVGAGKADVRRLAREAGLPNWDKPAQACLSSRFPYGSRITPAGLKRVEAAEEILRGLGLAEYRVRDHGDTARIEVRAEEIPSFWEDRNRSGLVERFKALGYVYVTLDLEGFRSGSMNEAL